MMKRPAGKLDEQRSSPVETPKKARTLTRTITDTSLASEDIPDCGKSKSPDVTFISCRGCHTQFGPELGSAFECRYCGHSRFFNHFGDPDVDA